MQDEIDNIKEAKDSIYMKLECVIDLLSEDEIQIAKSFGYSKPCREAPTGTRILFIVTSEDKRYYDWIPSMVYSLYFDELYHLTAIDPELHETLPQHLTFLMDELHMAAVNGRHMH